MVVKVTGPIFEKGEKLSNVIHDIQLLNSNGIRMVITHSEQRYRETWSIWEGIGEVALLDSSELTDVARIVVSGSIPAVFLSETDSMVNEGAIIDLAREVGAVKVIHVTKQGGLFRPKEGLISELDVSEAQDVLSDPDNFVTCRMRERVDVSIKACKARIVPRIHIIGSEEGALLKEVLTSEGSGTMIYNHKYKETRRARPEDIVFIFELIRESIKKTRTSLSLKFIAQNVADLWVFTVDNQIHGCVMVKSDHVGRASEISCLGVSSAYENSVMIQHLLKFSLEIISKETVRIFLDMDKNADWLGLYPWFSQLGFVRTSRRGKIWMKEV